MSPRSGELRPDASNRVSRERVERLIRLWVADVTEHPARVCRQWGTAIGFLWARWSRRSFTSPSETLVNRNVRLILTRPARAAAGLQPVHQLG
jgi:hypothetical protein